MLYLIVQVLVQLEITVVSSTLPILLSTSGGELHMNVVSHCTSACVILNDRSFIFHIALPTTSGGELFMNVRMSACVTGNY